MTHTNAVSVTASAPSSHVFIRHASRFAPGANTVGDPAPSGPAYLQQRSDATHSPPRRPEVVHCECVPNLGRDVCSQAAASMSAGDQVTAVAADEGNIPSRLGGVPSF